MMELVTLGMGLVSPGFLAGLVVVAGCGWVVQMRGTEALVRFTK